MVAAGATVDGESLAVMTTVEFMVMPGDGKVFVAAATVLEMTAGLDSAGAGLDAARVDVMVIGVEPLGTGAGVADTGKISVAVEDMRQSSGMVVIVTVTVAGWSQREAHRRYLRCHR